MFNGIKHVVPFPLKKAVRFSLAILLRKLAYLEFHLTDHCNFNCKGCFHYSSIAPERFANLMEFEQDMQKLNQLFRSIKTIRLMGGEPLLHPEVDRFILAARTAFPKAKISFSTNGTLLPQASQEFWEACRKTNATIDWTIYPPMQKYFEEYKALCAEKGANLSVNYVKTFSAYDNLKGDSPKERVFRHCIIGGYHNIYLQQGHLFTCPKSALVHYFNDKFNYDIPTDKGVNIDSFITSGRKALLQLNKPLNTCKWCSSEIAQFPWESACNPTPENWDLGGRSQGKLMNKLASITSYTQKH